MPYNRRPPAESEESAASVFAPFQPGVPAEAKEADYKDRPLPGDAGAPERVSVSALSAKKLQEAAERDEPPAKVDKPQPTVSSLVARSVADAYEGARMQPPRSLEESKPTTAKQPAKPAATKDAAKPAAKSG